MGKLSTIALILAGVVFGGESKGKNQMKGNHLIHEKSPYLLQHAHNPVDWYPWGEPAFEKARRENKPIILSIGYSTCHWCHVMERESFSDAAVAEVMNRHFVSIKVDREERPDVDKIYMTAVQAMSGQGGWPLNVFLTPELKPFFGGTYFPPEPRWGQPGFPQLLERVAELWKTKREEIGADASKLTELLRSYAAAKAKQEKLDPAWLDKAFAAYQGSFDAGEGGFGGAPKFPMPVNQNFLLRYYARTRNKEALRMAVLTLKAMARGGVYDQVGGGFHRYSTDAQWRVPHFEKMLYDNAQLAVNFLEAYQAEPDALLARVARETLDYVLRDMTDAEGGFYSAEDADSLEAGHEHKAEGAFYLWSEAEVKTILGEAAEVFLYSYGIRAQGNAPADPQGEFEGKNILYLKHGLDEAAVKFGRKEEELRGQLEAARRRLLETRAKRPRPGLDDKILTSWNGLMISALAKGYQVLGRPEHLAAAEKAAGFVKANLYDAKTRKLFHRWRKGEKAIDAIADDYAFLAQGLIDLYEASFEPAWLEWALELTEVQDRLFAAPEGGFYMTTEDHDPNLLARVMEDSDNVEPCASSVAALNLLRLSQFAHREDFRQSAQKTLERFGASMRERPLSLPQMLVALEFASAKTRQIVIAGEPQAAETKAMLKEIHSRFMADKILVLVAESSREGMVRLMPFLKGMSPIEGKTTAYVCENYACKLPTNDLAVLKKLLSE